MGVRELRSRKISKLGNFQAYIVATDLPDPDDHSPGPSAHAWEIRRVDGDQVEDGDAKASDRNDSDENRAYATGAFRVVEATPAHSTINICSPSDYIVRAINEWLIMWRANGWRGSDGKPIAHREWWQRFDAECTKRNLVVTAKRLRSDDWIGHMICKQLMQGAKKTCAKKKPQRPC